MTQLYVTLIPGILFVGAIVVLLIDAFSPKEHSSKHAYIVTIATLLTSLAASFLIWNKQGSAFNGFLVLDSFALGTTILFCFAGLVTTLLTSGSKHSIPQFYSLLLLTIIGMLLLVQGTHFLIIFIGLETLSLSIYVLAAFSKRDPISSESGLKYFLLGSFASAFFLYGMAFIYGSTGSLQLNAIASAIDAPGFANRNMMLLAIVFLIVGYGFKISLAPFHMWTPDVYEGAPTPVTAFMAATVKAAALASLIRVFLVSFQGVVDFWAPLIWIIAVVTMFAGNLTALWQDNIKRLLAYSSIAHAGYMLLGLLAKPEIAQQAILYYFAAYVFMNLGIFAIVIYLERNTGMINISDYTGLAYSRPYLAAGMLLFLISLGGLPPTAGFFGKFYLFRSVLDHGYVWAVVIAVLNSAISFFYYLRLVIAMFTPEKDGKIITVTKLATPIILVLLITLWGTLTLGLFPNFFLELARSVSMRIVA